MAKKKKPTGPNPEAPKMIARKNPLTLQEVSDFKYNEYYFALKAQNFSDSSCQKGAKHKLFEWLKRIQKAHAETKKGIALPSPESGIIIPKRAALVPGASSKIITLK